MLKPAALNAKKFKFASSKASLAQLVEQLTCNQ